MSFLDELKRRSVLKMAGLYLVASWLILQVADLLVDAFEMPSWTMRFLIVCLILGLPVSLAFAWIFKWIPDNVDPDRQTDSGRRGSAVRQRMNMAIVVLIALAVGVFGIGKLVPRMSDNSQVDRATPADISSRTIAVLPFLNLSDDPENEYFSDGLSEELLNVLATIPELQVIARTSSFSFKGKEVDIRSIGEQLSVANVLEGSVRKSGNQIRITAQLINAESGFHLWSESYDRTLDDIFAIQDEIAADVADALKVSILGATPQVVQTDPQAFSAYLQASYFYNRRSPEGYEKALDYVQQCIEIDPEYVPAWTLLSSVYANEALRGAMPFVEANEKALEAAEHALQLDPEFPYANSARAWLATTYQRDYATAALFYKRALELSPGNSVVLGNAAVLVRTLGRLDQAIEMSERSIALNPVSSTAYVNLADQLYRSARTSDAIEAASKALELSPADNAAMGNLAFSYLLAERPGDAIQAVEATTVRFLSLMVNSMANYSLGQNDDSEEQLRLLREEFSSTQAFYIALVHAWRSEHEDAFTWLVQAIDEGQPVLGINTDPFLGSLHDDPRWEPLLARIGMSSEQLAAVEF
jgi:TolB-like protein/Flp pilus assembly protein TadD